MQRSGGETEGSVRGSVVEQGAHSCGLGEAGRIQRK